MRQSLPFGELLPDQPAYANPGLLVADGVYPVARGYRPLGEFSENLGGLMAGDCLGGASYRASDGAVFVVGGTTTNLYRYVSSAWTSVGSGYSATAASGWRFAQWGDWIIATNGVQAPLKLDMVGASPSFSALGGTPPTGDLITIVRDFVVLGRADGDAYKLQWSGINNAEQWTVGSNQSDFQIMPTGGEITGITGGEYGLVLQENRISRMTYVGGALVFQFDEISAAIGCIDPWSVVQVGRLTFFMSAQGFAVCDGNTVTLIGDEKVNKTSLVDIDRSVTGGMSATVDPRYSLVIWAMPNTAPSSKMYIFNYAQGKWSTATQDTQKLFQNGLTTSVTLEELDTLYTSIDAMTASLDDQQWRGGYPMVYLVNGSRQLGTLGTVPKAATFTTGYIALAGEQRARLQEVQPVVDTVQGLSLSVNGKERLGDLPQTGSYSALNRRGAFKTREAWRYMSLTLSIAAGTEWTEAQGLEAELVGGGK